MKLLSILIVTLYTSVSLASFWIPDGSISNKKLAAVNTAESASIMFTSGSPTPVPIVNITTTGRPVLFQLMPADITGGTIGTFPGSVNVSIASGTAAGGVFNVQRGGVTIRSMNHFIGGATGNLNSAVPCPSFAYIDTPPAGTHGYSFTISGVTGIMQVSYCRIVVREL